MNVRCYSCPGLPASNVAEDGTMLKKIGLPFLALAALLMVVPAQKANAAVRFGVVVGGPVYAYPAYPGPYAYPYSSPYTTRIHRTWRLLRATFTATAAGAAMNGVNIASTSGANTNG